jgi:hypothetical protein
MNGMDINFYSVNKEFHRYSTDDFALLEIGIGSYNISSLANFFSLDPSTLAPLPGRSVNPDIVEFFSGGGKTVPLTLLGFGAVTDVGILAFDEVDKEYKLKRTFFEITRLDPQKFKPEDFTQPPANLKLFLETWNKIQLGIEKDQKLVNGYKAVAHRIQNSASGCITFSASLRILNTFRSPKIRLYLLESRDNESSRTISFNGSPFISAVPRTAEGMRYGWRNKNDGPTGLYSAPSFGGNSTEDMVGGELRMSFDPVTGTWESGTQQTLARLLDDIDAASIPELTPEDMRSLTAEESYNVPAEENPWMGKPQKGRAVVLSIENGNPNLYGPNFRGGCEDTSQKSIVMAVNRSSKSFKAGTLVVLSFINGEWLIVGGEGDDQGSATAMSFGNFEYNKNIIPANKFFTLPGSAEKLMPDTIVRKLRNWFYLQLGSSPNFSPEYADINFLAASAPPGSDVVSYIIQNRKNAELLASLRAFAVNDTKSMVSDISFPIGDFSAQYLNSSVREILLLRDGPPIAGFGIVADQSPAAAFGSRRKLSFVNLSASETLYNFPKNILARTAKRLNLNLPGVQADAASPIDRFEAPLFWGVLFPDGFKAAQAAPFLISHDRLKDKSIYNTDPNLKELSLAAGFSLPFFKDEMDLFLYLAFDSRDTVALPQNIRPSDLMRKSGVLLRSISQSQFSLRFESHYQDKKEITGLEPIQPKRLQFSPMSIEGLYSGTPELMDGFALDAFPTINSYLVYLNSVGLLDYARFVTWPEVLIKKDIFPETAFNFALPNSITSYNFWGLDFGTSFGRNQTFSRTAQRHPAPLGTTNGNLLLPSYANFPRSPCMPVLTIKSNIKTSAKSLRFKTIQRFGNPQKTTISGGQGPEVTIIPIFPGLAWNTPATPIQVRSDPQWGDRSNTDDIDSFGTTALHIRIFEAWPVLQTSYVTWFFTPLHFSDAASVTTPMKSFDQETRKFVDIKNDDNKPVLYRSPVDYRQPTNKSNNLIQRGQAVTEEILAPFSQWGFNGSRRRKLLSGGGYAYFRKAIFVNSSPLDPDAGVGRGGSGYKKGDELVYPDGSIIKVTNVGEVTLPNGSKLTDSITTFTFEPNFDSDLIVKNMNSFTYLTSISSVRPVGGSGSGARFKPTFIIGLTIEHDPAPKEVTPITRITKSSNRGVDFVQGELTTVVELQDTNKREFDIFYFFHNDPVTYSIVTDLFNSPDAHYVISEVDPT